MKPGLDREVVVLRRNALLRIHAIAGRKIVCMRGNVWLTQEGDRRDFVLARGAEFALDRAGIALAWATGGDAVLVLDQDLHAEHVQEDAPRRFPPTHTLQDAIDAIEPRYEPGKLATMPIDIRNAVIRREAKWLRAEVGAVLWQAAARFVAEVSRRFAASVFAPPSTRTVLRRAE